MKKTFYLIIVLLLFAVPSIAENRLKYNGFSGGMLLHSGYVSSGNLTFQNIAGETLWNGKLSGAPFGIGGMARLHFGNHLRVGAEGYVSELALFNHGSSTTGWGGILVNYAWETWRFVPFAGLTFGGASVESLIILDSDKSLIINDFTAEQNPFVLRKNACLVLAPCIGTEIVMNKKMHLALKADFIANISNRNLPDFMQGIRIYFGFLFCR